MDLRSLHFEVTLTIGSRDRFKFVAHVRTCIGNFSPYFWCHSDFKMKGTQSKVQYKYMDIGQQLVPLNLDGQS